MNRQQLHHSALALDQQIATTTNAIARDSITLKNNFHIIGAPGLSFSAVVDSTATGGSGGEEELIALNDYDELGQLSNKRVGGVVDSLDVKSSPGLQIVDYAYNVRGWLKGINDVGSTDKLFNFRIAYNDPVHGAAPLFNGNISETDWRTDNTDSSLKWYRYVYDPLNRLINAQNWNNSYNLSYVTYDKNGNIVTLKRHGWQNSTNYWDMDVLAYDYDSGNKLLNVTDTGNNAYGFIDGANTADDFGYDPNGNMVHDLNKGIGTALNNGITYNHLNLPVEVKFDNDNLKKITYIYDAMGSKLQKAVTDGSSVITDYVGNYIYENGSLVQFFHPEGYIEPDGSGGYDYVYQYSDHLGNVRLAYQDINDDGYVDQSEILLERNYYPFGLEHKGYNSNINGVENDYKQFQGQEWTEDLGLNIHEWKYRISDPAIGRFWQIDPLAEDYSYQSPYNFSENRLIDSAELEGLERIYAADGKLMGQVGDSQEIRVMQNTDGTSQAQSLINTANNTELSSEERSAASSALNSSSFHGFETNDAAASSFAHSNNPQSIESNQEMGAAINTVTLSNGDGSDIEGTTNNTVAILGPTVNGSEKKVNTDVLKGPTVKLGNNSIETPMPGTLSGFVHTHGNGSNDFSRGGDNGGLTNPTDQSTSSRYNVPVYMSNKRGELKVLDANRGVDKTIHSRVRTRKRN